MSKTKKPIVKKRIKIQLLIKHENSTNMKKPNLTSKYLHISYNRINIYYFKN